MKIRYQSIATILLFLLLTAVSHAENAQKAAPPATPPKDMGTGGGMGIHHGMGMHHGMGGGMMAGMTEEQKTEHLRTMQEHMLKMHDLSNQILAEKDSAKKEELKKQQLELMKAHHAQMMERHQHMRGQAPKK